MHLQPHEIPFSITLDSSQTGTIITLPFSLPPTAVRLDWKLIQGPKAPYVIDLGLKDSARIRGWSGGTRTEATLSLSQATPGYLAGGFPGGPWGLLVGLYRLPLGPTTIRIIVTWYEFIPQRLRGDLHTHTVHSDGVWTIDQLFEEAASIGLDFVATTDHNTASQNLGVSRDPATSIIQIPGMEWTTYHGHASILGLEDPLADWRVNDAQEMGQRLAELKQNGAIVSVNHPFDEFQPGLTWNWGDRGLGFMEVWNGPWRPANQRALDHWQQRLSDGAQVVALGGSDTHGPSDIVHLGEPTNWVWTDSPTTAGLLQGISQGHLYITRDAGGPELSMQSGPFQMGDRTTTPNPDIAIELDGIEIGDRIRLISDQGAEYEASAKTENWSLTHQARGRRFIRLEVHRYSALWDYWMPLLIGNPIYFGGGPTS